MQIEGQAAIVTGGASGLGAATARLLAARGAKVAIFDRQPEVGDALAREVGGVFSVVDVRREGDVDAALNAAEAAHGVARILVNCAGIVTAMKTVARDFTPHALDRFQDVIDINLTGTFLVLSRFAARLAQVDPIGEERGVIINTASIAGYDGQIGHAAYAASKAGVIGMTLPIARELAASKIRVMSIAPGVFATPMVASLTPKMQRAVEQAIPHPSRMGRPEEFAMLAESIITNPILNGETIRIDAAIRLPPR
jgi:NAD(P)-dependent dehydrogenase (short-subunit alcohol dehydrogenase family)